jgi:hypothetical protein
MRLGAVSPGLRGLRDLLPRTREAQRVTQARRARTLTKLLMRLPRRTRRPPSISGTAQVGSLLTATTGTWTGLGLISYTYQWEDCDSSSANCTNISGATSSTYTVQSSDENHRIRVAVAAEN